jgi:RNA polymerase sigma-70 factor (ECF subfamily)
MVAASTLIDSAQAAFERLFAQEYRRVTSVAFRITRDAEEAEDVAQDVFLRFARKGRANFDGARSWLYQAAVHTALNAIRSRRRRAEREAREFRLSRPLERAGDPHEEAERRAQAAVLRAALLRLKPNEAAILAMRYGGLSYREIADAVRIDVAQIGTRLARAERALKQEIERETLG